ncbi:MAG: DUF6273 domain-containing protein [Clostridiales Family XIII bacterium]|nr:DUF6273 domain-containing protein [Clostridia bacterium]MDY3012544.1 DUF6273 domain-containing protein [Clostridiales Family XIII bacterium]
MISTIRWKRVMAAVLSLCLITATIPLLPGEGFLAMAAAKEKLIQAGSKGIANPSKPADENANWSGEYLYFGEYYQTDDTAKEPIKWKVLDNDKKNGLSSENGGMLLLSDQIVDCVKFNESAWNEWEDSNLLKWLNSDSFSGSYTSGGFLDTAFQESEEGAIWNSNGRKGANTDFIYGSFTNPAIGKQKIFCLTAADALNEKYGFYNTKESIEVQSRKQTVTTYAKGQGAYEDPASGIGTWWLRSAFTSTDYTAAVVDFDGWVDTKFVNDPNVGAAPAFNLKRSSVLFTSAAEGSKSSTFKKVATNGSITEWKATLSDKNSMSGSAGVSGKGVSGNTVTLTKGYPAAALTIRHPALQSFGSANYTNVTAALTDSRGEILYYGSINGSKTATSSSLTIPAGLPLGTYTLKIYGEQWNGDKRTDYATGTPYTINLNVKAASLAAPKIKGSVTYNSAKVSWKKVKDAAGYQVYRAAKNGKYKKVKTTKATSWTNKKLTTGRSYYYKVRAYKKQGGKNLYSKFSKRLKAVPRTKAPSYKLTAGKKKIRISWKKVHGADGYRIYRAKSKNGKYKRIKDSRSKLRRYTSICLTSHHRYYYKVRSYRIVKGKKVYSPYSTVKSVRTK